MAYAILAAIDQLTVNSNFTCTNDCVILTLDNIVEFLGDIEIINYEANEVIATLPEDFRPSEPITIPVVVEETIMPLLINNNGNIGLNEDVPGDSIIYLNGVNFNICSKFYNHEIGNNFNQGTSSLTGGYF